MNSTDGAAAIILERIEQLAKLSESPDGITRRYLTPAHAAANRLVGRWMSEAGMRTAVDAVGNIVGRWDPPSAPTGAVVLGSHLDSVPDGGRYDGILGVVTAIECIDRLNRSGCTLGRPVEIVGFGDEEGARFHAAYLGSRGFAGCFDPVLLELRDADGIPLGRAMEDFGLDPARVAEAARDPKDLHCYLELHIEQGPVLENSGLALGVVSAINGQTRAKIRFTGVTGHAGTVPMGARHDALAGAAEVVLAVEEICRGLSARGVVGTVGDIQADPGASNVIPGTCEISLDLRAPDDSDRETALHAIRDAAGRLADRRGLGIAVTVVDDKPSVICSPRLRDIIFEELEFMGLPPLSLGSGAGHDAVVMAPLTEVGMIFVRCRGGVSHNPEEHVAFEDIDAAYQLLRRVLLRISEER